MLIEGFGWDVIGELDVPGELRGESLGMWSARFEGAQGLEVGIWVLLVLERKCGFWEGCWGGVGGE